MSESMQGQGGFRYLFPSIEVEQAQDFVPFSIDLPNDIAAVTGVLVLTNAIVSLGGGDAIDEAALAALEASIATAQQHYRQTNVLNGFFEYEAGLGLKERIQLDRFVLGTISLRSFEQSGLFFSQSVLPQAFGFHFKSPYGQEAHGRFEYHAVTRKSRAFVPVHVDGLSTELFGFFEPTAFGKEIGTWDTRQYDRFTEQFVEPYRITLALKCITKPESR